VTSKSEGKKKKEGTAIQASLLACEPVVDMKYMKLGSKPDAFQTEGNSIR
jgi:hypothetical protein